MLLMEAAAALTPQTQTHLMKSSLSSKLKPALSFLTSSKLRPLCTHSITPNNNNNNIVITPKKPVSKVRVKVSDAAQLKENWLNSLSCPSLHTNTHLSNWVIGIDPDLSGAFALLKTDDSGSSAQVFDSPYLPVLVGKRVRKRLDAKSIVQLVRSLDAPTGTTAYIEQSIPYPQDGKQGWWSGGFGYGLWIGILVASGFSVVPVPSLLWKNEFELSGVRSTKDESRRIASMLFPSLSSQLKRKKDHGRAEALLIAAYGKGLKIS